MNSGAQSRVVPITTVYISQAVSSRFGIPPILYILNQMSLNDATILVFGGSRNIGYLSSVRLLG